MTNGRKLIAGISQVLSVWPWVVLVFVLFGAVYTRASFGRWPRVYVDNPPDPLIDALSYFSILSVLFTVVVPPLAAVVLAIRGAAGLRPALDKCVISALVGSAVLLAVVQSDPYGYVTWLLD